MAGLRRLKMNCPKCKTNNRPGAPRCKKCAQPLPASCFGCGVPVAPNIELCLACRKELVPQALGAYDPTPAEPKDLLTDYPLEARFIGRKALLDRLRRLFAGCVSGREGAFVTLTGAPGAGKTRLGQELTQLVRTWFPEARVLLVPCGGPGAPPYAAFGRLFVRRFDIQPGEVAKNAREKIRSTAVAMLGERRGTEAAHLIGELARFPFEGSPIIGPLAETPAQLEARMFIAVRRFLFADADKTPLLLVFDQIERATQETVNLIHYLVAGIAGHPIMLLCLGRNSVFDVHPSFGEGDFAVERVELEPLPASDSATLLGELLRPTGAKPPNELVAPAQGSLGGSPGALLDFVRLLLEAGIIRPKLKGKKRPDPEGASHAQPGQDGAWTLDKEALHGYAARIPTTHEEVLSERLRMMPAGERDLLEKAAVCGEAFWLDAVVALMRAAALDGDDPDGPTLGGIATAGDRTRTEAAQTLAQLERRGLVAESATSLIPGEKQWQFAYQPLQEMVYAGMADGPRARYHRLLAQWLELRPGGRNEEEQEEIGRHLQRAGDGDGASVRYRRAAEAARARYYNDKAIRLYADALGCLGRDDVSLRIHLWHDLGGVYALKGDFEAALQAFERMLRLSWVVASRSKGAVAFNKIGRIHRQKGDLTLALEYLERAAELFEQAQDERGIAGSLDDIGQVLWMLGRYDEAMHRSARALELRRKFADRRSIAASLSNIGLIEKDRGLFAEAEGCHREALEISRELGDRAGTAEARKNLGILAAARGDAERARRHWERALKTAHEIDMLPLQAALLTNLGELALAEGNLAEAKRRHEDALVIARDLEDRRAMSDALRGLGLCELAAGNRDKAVTHCVTALDLATKGELRDAQGRALVALGEITAAGPVATASPSHESLRPEEYFGRGIELFREMGNRIELARGLDRLGRYHVAQGERAVGKALLDEARLLFENLGIAPGPEAADADGTPSSEVVS